MSRELLRSAERGAPTATLVLCTCAVLPASIGKRHRVLAASMLRLRRRLRFLGASCESCRDVGCACLEVTRLPIAERPQRAQLAVVRQRVQFEVKLRVRRAIHVDVVVPGGGEARNGARGRGCRRIR